MITLPCDTGGELVGGYETTRLGGGESGLHGSMWTECKRLDLEAGVVGWRGTVLVYDRGMDWRAGVWVGWWIIPVR